METEQLIIATEQQVQIHFLSLRIVCMLCQVLSFGYFPFDIPYVMPDCLKLTVHDT